MRDISVKEQFQRLNRSPLPERILPDGFLTWHRYIIFVSQTHVRRKWCSLMNIPFSEVNHVINQNRQHTLIRNTLFPEEIW
ncbi:hypothetical protein Mhun_0307 [Methanospirillum hungatei JF-1]|uniref:Uncharacterized protein n=1 Tax=Methanospirillum hungatei JF-1 (strain ATCC 27890 / DSM 864 / NBRC 100397 / JF-1) TaxID=323259 RepID=Q2FPS6_METHJ|nr:hypothetical protein Mhun_0307 [Methanospirillum hungatei JF-1]